jgi:biopolymer transport protein ExbD
MPRRSSPEISAGSMADIAFLLLIFFLVTTTMEKEAGIMRILPEISQEVTEPINRRNVIDILVNDENKILFKGEPVKLNEVKPRLMEIILNTSNNPKWPENFEIEYEKLKSLTEAAKEELANADPDQIKTLQSKLETAELRQRAYEVFSSDFKKSAHVVSIQSTRGAEYKTYIELSDQVLLAYSGLREKLAKKRLNKNWKDLSNDEKEMLRLVYPTNISEAQTVQGASR